MYDRDAITHAIHAQMRCFGDPVQYALGAGWWLDATPGAEVLQEYAKAFKDGVTVRRFGVEEDLDTLRTLTAISVGRAYRNLGSMLN